ncbi:MAG: T9SS type A sorting domain-containing protein [Candidatus Cloacimonetes bacterium]|nr:T9SS type A sorting domain-containing protein [Candidatus Cloacimonadota bacterium]
MKKSMLLILICLVAAVLFAQNPPTNVAVDGNTGIVTWTDPAGTSGWMHYDNGSNDDGIGTGAAANINYAIRWTAAGLAPYAGLTITQVKFFPKEAACTYAVKIWEGASAATLIMTENVAAPIIDSWNTITLTTPYQITGAVELWIGVNANTTTGYPCGCDAGPAVAGFGDMISTGGAWSPISGMGLDYNWNIQAYATDDTGRVVALDREFIESAEVVAVPNTAGLRKGNLPASRNSRELLGFNVYLEGVMVGQNIQSHEFRLNPVDMIPNADFTAGVSAVHDSGESVIVDVDFTFTPPFYGIYPPSNVNIIETGGILTWEEPVLPGDWMGWCADEPGGNGIGLTNGGTFSVAARWDVASLADYIGNNIVMMRFVPGSMDNTYTAKIWMGANAATLIWSEEITEVVVGQWNEVQLPSPFTIDGTQELWVGYTVNSHVAGAYPASGDEGPAIVGFGDKIQTGGTWANLSDLGDFDYNWSVQAFVFESGRTVALERPNPAPEHSNVTLDAEFSVGRIEASAERSLLGYNIYLDGTMVDAGIQNFAYVYEGLSSGSNHLAGISSVYHEGESSIVEVPFTYYPAGFFYPPTDLTAMQNGDTVELNWTAPIAPDFETMGYCVEENNDAIGFGEPADFDIATRWTLPQLLPYHGMYLSEIEFFAYEANCEYSVRVWTGVNAANLIVDEVVVAPTTGEWNSFTLPTPVMIDMTQELWFGLRCNTQGTHPAPIDAGPAVGGFGDMIKSGSSWASIFESSTGSINGNWNIRGKAVYEVPVARDADSYEVYSSTNGTDFVMLGSTTDTNYTDTDPMGEAFNYYQVKAVYDGSASEPAEINLFVMPDTYEVLSYDDDSAEEGMNAGITNQMGVFFDGTARATLKMLSFYVETVGTAPIIYRVFDNDGAEGMPGTQLLQSTIAPANLQTGWNSILVPANPVIQDVVDGDFYVCILETANASAIGFDTNSNGNSYLKQGAAAWAPITEGNLMIRATIDLSTGNDDEVAPVRTFSLNNYPNPFNPETNISFNIPADGVTTLKVYNVRGQLVNTLVNDQLKAGQYNVVWNGTDSVGKSVSSGIYMYRLSNNGKNLNSKMLLAK